MIFNIVEDISYRNMLESQIFEVIEYLINKNEELSLILTKIGFEIENIINLNLHSSDEFDKYIFVCKKG